MSKYIIDIPKTVGMTEKVGSVHYTYFDGIQCKTIILKSDEIEELNSDYINEHYGSLQDEAYQKGYEDGKWKAEDGCDGCKYYEDTSLTNPCSECSRGHVDRYEPLSEPDRIEVGDEVKAPFGTAVVVCCDYDADKASYIYSSGRHGFDNTWNLKKTGKHYDIASILEAMRK